MGKFAVGLLVGLVIHDVIQYWNRKSSKMIVKALVRKDPGIKVNMS